ncbi:MAG: transporter substrate-binding domain-containing protein [Oscillospiraceae bacterium]
MKKRVLLLLLVFGLVLTFCSCGNEKKASGYSVVGSIGSEQYLVAFRDGDKLRDIITAGMMVLSNDGTLSQLSTRWLNDDRVTIPGSTEVEGWLQNQPQRVLILGYYAGAKPMCFEQDGSVTGFDAEMFTEICNRLGWELHFQAIDRGNASVELASGNVDCVAGGFGTGDDISGLSTSPEYMDTKYVIITKASSGIKRTGQLKGKTLGTVGSSSMGKALEADEKLVDRLGGLKVLNSEEECFTALDAGLCDAILVTETCADYYMR